MYFLLCSLFSLTLVWSDATDDAVENLCKSSKDFEPSHSFCHTYYAWANYFHQKMEKNEDFAKANRSALNAFFTRAAGFGGFSNSKKADEASSSAWHKGIIVLYKTGDRHSDFPLPTDSDPVTQLAEKIRNTYCFKAINERLPALGLALNLKTPTQQAQTLPCHVVITPIFVTQEGCLVLVPSVDWTGYSAAYGGNAEGKPDEKIFDELNEEFEGLFSCPCERVKNNVALQKASKQMKMSKEVYKKIFSSKDFNNRSNNTYQISFIDTHFAMKTWISNIQGNNSLLTGVAFLPIEVLQLDKIETEKLLNQRSEVSISCLCKDQLNKASYLGQYYLERSKYTAVCLADFMKRTIKKGNTRVPIDRFSKKVRFDGDHMLDPVLQGVLSALGEKSTQYTH